MRTPKWLYAVLAEDFDGATHLVSVHRSQRNANEAHRQTIDREEYRVAMTVPFLNIKAVAARTR